jgi:hypothetical protein
MAARIGTDGFVDPCVPTLAAKPPSGPDRVDEIRQDGYRLIVRLDGAAVRILPAGDRGRRRVAQVVHSGRRGGCGRDDVAVFGPYRSHKASEAITFWGSTAARRRIRGGITAPASPAPGAAAAMSLTLRGRLHRSPFGGTFAPLKQEAIELPLFAPAWPEVSGRVTASAARVAGSDGDHQLRAGRHRVIAARSGGHPVLRGWR